MTAPSTSGFTIEIPDGDRPMARIRLENHQVRWIHYEDLIKALQDCLGSVVHKGTWVDLLASERLAVRLNSVNRTFITTLAAGSEHMVTWMGHSKPQTVRMPELLCVAHFHDGRLTVTRIYTCAKRVLNIKEPGRVLVPFNLGNIHRGTSHANVCWGQINVHDLTPATPRAVLLRYLTSPFNTDLRCYVFDRRLVKFEALEDDKDEYVDDEDAEYDSQGNLLGSDGEVVRRVTEAGHCDHVGRWISRCHAKKLPLILPHPVAAESHYTIEEVCGAINE